jgi:hypothetical protein
MTVRPKSKTGSIPARTATIESGAYSTHPPTRVIVDVITLTTPAARCASATKVLADVLSGFTHATSRVFCAVPGY